jgi:hypothetical protein
MSIWSSRFGQEGVNLAADNSFRLQITNASTSPFTLNLFNLGGSASNQTSITTGLTSVFTGAQLIDTSGPIVISNTPTIPALVNGVVVDIVGLDVAYGRVGGGSSPTQFFPTGTTLAQINAFYENNVTNNQGQVGSMIIAQKPLSTDEYYVFVTIPNILNFSFADFAFPPLSTIFSFSNQEISYVTSNPLVTFRGPKNINISYIQNSEIGNSYKVTGMDVYSNKQSQVLEPLNYFYRDANGQVQGAVTSPTIDPYQPNRASLQMIYVDDFQIFTNTQFQYIIDGLTSVYLTFNYVNFGVEDFKMFDKVFYQQVRDKFWMDKKLIQQSRVKSIHIE